MAGTHEEAMLLMQIAHFGTDTGLPEATRALMSPGFNPEAVEARDPHVHAVLEVGEMLGTFVKNDLLSRDLVTDLFWIEGMWERVGPAALKMREQLGEPRLFENFEALAT